MKTFEKVLEIFREYLDCDLEEEVLPCREGYLRVTWNGDSRYCVDGLLSRHRTNYSRCCYLIIAAMRNCG